MPSSIAQAPEIVISRIVGTLMLLALALSLALVGCERRERIVDIDTPAGSIEVDKKTHLDGTQSIEVEKTAPPQQPVAP